MKGHLILNRSEKGGIHSTLGTLTYAAAFFGCLTLEKPWDDNKRRVSCFPAGVYPWSKRGATEKIPYPHIIIHNIPDRDGICIHAANFVRSLEGCAAVGDSFIDIDNDGALDVANSRQTLVRLLEVLPKEGTIEII